MTAYLIVALLAALALFLAVRRTSFGDTVRTWLASTRRERTPSPDEPVVIQDGEEIPLADAARPRPIRRSAPLAAPRVVSRAFSRPRNDRRTRSAEQQEAVRRREWRRTARMQRYLASRRGRRVGVAFVTIVLGAILLWQLLDLTANRVNRFVVLVAPFRSADARGGETVARQLVDVLNQTGSLSARAISTPPNPDDLAASLTLMEREGADALIWGDVADGAMLDALSLRPVVLYQPTGTFAPAAWSGYTGRFAMPVAFTISDTPINGQVVVPALLDGLADYSAGRFDDAYTNLGTLADAYPILPALPRSLRGNMLWADGQYTLAADEYRKAGALDANVTGAPQLARLTNNLGAILSDAGEINAARDAYSRAVALLAGQDLGELRVNLADLALADRKPAEALTQLQQARNLMPPTTLLLTRMARAYREDGQYDQASEFAQLAETQIAADTNRTTPDQRPILEAALAAQVAHEQALQQVATALDARTPLWWEFQAFLGSGRTDRSIRRAFADGRDLLTDAQARSEEAMRRWMRRAAAEDAAGRQLAGKIATGQAGLIEAEMREQQETLATFNLITARLEGYVPPTGFRAFWLQITGDRSPMGQALSTLRDLNTRRPNDFQTQIVLGQALLLNEQVAEAQTRFEAAYTLDPNRPEALYGRGLVALRTSAETGQTLLQEAIQRNPSYFPARERLAEVAEDRGDWAVAIEQRRWQDQERPSPTTKLRLAAALRQSGAGGYAEAEQLLLPLANANNANALTELGRLYTATGNYPAAHTALRRAQNADPNASAPFYEEGRVYLAEQQGAQAEALFRQAIANDSGDIRSRLALAAYYGSSNTAESTRAYREALDSGVNDPASLREIGAALLANEAYDPAAEAFRRALRQEQRAEAHLGLAQALVGLQAYSDAETSANAALAMQTPYPQATVVLGDVALARNDLAGAQARYEEALQQSPELATAYLGLGQVSYRQARYSVAETQFARALVLDASSADAAFWVGESRFAQGNYTAAIDAYQNAIDRDQQMAEAYYGKARAQNIQGDPDGAQESLAAALANRANYGEALLLRGQLNEEQGRFDAAASDYGAAIRANDTLATAYYRRALLSLQGDRVDDARKDLQQAVRRQQQFPEAYYWLGRTNLILGNYEDSNAAFKTAIEQQGGSYPEAQFYQGLAQAQLGQRNEAIASLEAAIQQGRSNPWVTEAEQALARLRQ